MLGHGAAGTLRTKLHPLDALGEMSTAWLSALLSGEDPASSVGSGPRGPKCHPVLPTAADGAPRGTELILAKIPMFLNLQVRDKGQKSVTKALVPVNPQHGYQHCQFAAQISFLGN